MKHKTISIILPNNSFAMFHLFLIIITGCSVQSPIEGLYELRNDKNTTGYLSGNRKGIEVYINHPHLSTDGWKKADIELEDEGGFWAFFDIETAMDTAHAALRVQGKEARLPLGARRGEFDLIFTIEPSSQEKDIIHKIVKEEDQIRKSNLDQQKKFWSLQQHVIIERNPAADGDISEEKIVGYIDWNMEQIDVFDSNWYTSTPQNFAQEVEGGDLLLIFDVEPSFQGEKGLIRCNVITRELTIPSSSIPSSVDRRLYIQAPPLDLDLQKYKKNAEKEAATLEFQWISDQAKTLYNSLESTCVSWKNQSILDSWLGYRFETQKIDSGCQIEVIPDPPQHRRQFEGFIYPDGRVNHKKVHP